MNNYLSVEKCYMMYGDEREYAEENIVVTMYFRPSCLNYSVVYETCTPLLYLRSPIMDLQ